MSRGTVGGLGSASERIDDPGGPSERCGPGRPDARCVAPEKSSQVVGATDEGCESLSGEETTVLKLDFDDELGGPGDEPIRFTSGLTEAELTEALASSSEIELRYVEESQGVKVGRKAFDLLRHGVVVGGEILLPSEARKRKAKGPKLCGSTVRVHCLEALLVHASRAMDNHGCFLATDKQVLAIVKDRHKRAVGAKALETFKLAIYSRPPAPATANRKALPDRPATRHELVRMISAGEAGERGSRGSPSRYLVTGLRQFLDLMPAADRHLPGLNRGCLPRFLEDSDWGWCFTGASPWPGELLGSVYASDPDGMFRWMEGHKIRKAELAVINEMIYHVEKHRADAGLRAWIAGLRSET